MYLEPTEHDQVYVAYRAGRLVGARGLDFEKKRGDERLRSVTEVGKGATWSKKTFNVFLLHFDPIWMKRAKTLKLFH